MNVWSNFEGKEFLFNLPMDQTEEESHRDRMDRVVVQFLPC